MPTLALCLALAQPAPPPKPAAGPPEFEVQFTDGGRIRAMVPDASAVVHTRYGKRTIPLADLRRVDLGFRSPVGVEDKVTAAVAKLGSAAVRDREDAARELFDLKEYAVPAVRRAAKAGDPEVVRRAEPLLRKRLDAVPEDRHSARDHDVIETAEFTVKGRLELAVLRVRSRQFGVVTLEVDELRAVRNLTSVGTAAELSVEAKFARLNWAAWLDTGVDVTADGPLTLTASGTVDRWPQEPGWYMTGPAGTQA
jgi:hypothetical protein